MVASIATYLFTRLGSKATRKQDVEDAIEAAVSDIDVRIARIETDIKWIMKEMGGPE
jgi:hypothetical protein